METILRPSPTPTPEASAGYDALVVPRVDDDGSKYFLASYPELPGCKAHGATPGEALDNLVEALALYRQMAARTNSTLPAPHPDPQTTIAEQLPSTVSGSTGTTVLNVAREWSLRTGEDEEEQPAFREVVAG